MSGAFCVAGIADINRAWHFMQHLARAPPHPTDSVSSSAAPQRGLRYSSAAALPGVP